MIGLVGLLCLLFAAESVQADAWPQRKGHGYYKVGFRMVRATQYYEPGGNRIGIPTLSDYVASFYGEYGLTGRVTAVAYLPFFERITLNEQVGRESGFVYFEGDAISSVADPEFGVRVGLIQGGATVLSAAFKVGVPLGDHEQEHGLFTGDGEFNQQAGLEVGHSFWPRPAYALACVGYNNRTRGYSDEVVYKVEGGYTVAGVLTLIGRLRGVASVRNGDDGVMGGTGGLGANNQRYLAYGAELIYTTGAGYGFSFNVEGATLAQSVLAAPAFSVGVFVNR